MIRFPVFRLSQNCHSMPYFVPIACMILNSLSPDTASGLTFSRGFFHPITSSSFRIRGLCSISTIM